MATLEPPPPILLLSMTLHAMEYPWVTWGQLSWLCPLTTSCSLPACLLEARGRMMLALDAAQALSAIAKILVCFQHCLVTNLNHSTIQGVGKKNNSIPVKLSTICKKNFSPPRYSFCRHSLYDSPLGYQQPEEQTPKLEEAHDH